MEYKYKLEKTNLIEFQTKYFKKTDAAIKAYRTRIILLISLFLLMILISYSNFYRIELLILLLLFLLIDRKYVNNKYYKRFRKLYDNESHRNFFESSVLALNDKGLIISSEFVQRSYKWSSIIKLYHVDDFILIRSSTDEIIYIPVVSFNDIKYFIDKIVCNINVQIEKIYPCDIKYK